MVATQLLRPFLPTLTLLAGVCVVALSQAPAPSSMFLVLVKAAALSLGLYLATRAASLAIARFSQKADQQPFHKSTTIPIAGSWHVPPPSTDAVERLQRSVTPQTFFVVGGGLAGLSVAASLHKVGVPVAVLERDSKASDYGAAITFWPNAFKVLDALGVAEGVRAAHPLLTRVEINPAGGGVLRSFALDECPGGPHEARIVRRSHLLKALLSAVPEECLHYGVAVDTVTSIPEGVEVKLVGGTVLRGRALVGCDGVKSRVAKGLGMRPAAYAGEVYYRGLATFPEGCPEDPGTLRMIWGRGVRVGISTLSRTDCFWFTTLACPEQLPSTDGEQRKQEALASVSGFSFHIRDAIRNTPKDLVSCSRITDRWLPARKKGYGMGTVTVAGDALHPMTPSLGQGGCTALEDGVVLARLVLQAGGAEAPLPHLESALREFESARCARCLPVTLRSNLMGAALQIRFLPMCWVRDWLVRRFYPVHSFLAPASFDCGTLPARPVDVAASGLHVQKLQQEGLFS